VSSYNQAVVFQSNEASAVAGAVAVLRKKHRSIKVEKPELAQGRVKVLSLPDKMLYDADATEDLLATVSLECRVEIVFVLALSNVDSFQFSHWRCGKLLRALTCGSFDQFIWSRVEGRPEEWEARAFKGSKVRSIGGRMRQLGRQRRGGAIAAPKVGDFSVGVDVMDCARCALEFYASALEL
jgi:hypothetical protein